MARQMLGFDIGDDTVNLALLSGEAIKKTVLAETPDQLVNNGEILSMDAMGDFLRQTAREQGLPRCGAAVVLPASQVFTRNVTVPAMTDRQLAYNLPYEFRDYLTEEKSKYFFDYEVREILRDEAGEPVEMRLFACAVLKSTIGEYRDMFRRAGFRLKVAVPVESAYSNLLSAYLRRTKTPAGDVCFINLGHRSTNIHIYHGSEHDIKRSIDLGMSDLEQLISDRSFIDVHMARAYIKSDNQDVLQGEECMELYHRLAVEVMKAVNFYNYNNPEGVLENAYLCGGGAAVKPLGEAIAQMTNLHLRPVTELLAQGETVEHPWQALCAVGCGVKG